MLQASAQRIDLTLLGAVDTIGKPRIPENLAFNDWARLITLLSLSKHSILNLHLVDLAKSISGRIVSPFTSQVAGPIKIGHRMQKIKLTAIL